MILFNSSEQETNPIKRIQADIWVSKRCVLLQPLDENLSPINSENGGSVFASGFIVHGAYDNAHGIYPPKSGKTHLYTCWHVVAGHDPRSSLTPRAYNRRRFLKIITSENKANTEITADDPFVVPLYGDGDKSLWEQEKDSKPHADFNDIGLEVPKNLDAIRIELNSKFDWSEWQILPQSIDTWPMSLGDDVYVAGYPNGFSAMGEKSIDPVFLKRSIASVYSKDIFVSLLDHECAPVMSGGPVFARKEDEWKLVGMYSGSAFTNGSSASLTLGNMMHHTYIAQSIGTVRQDHK